MIVLAFVLGCMCSQMMKQMCGGRLVEGLGEPCVPISDKSYTNYCLGHNTQDMCEKSDVCKWDESIKNKQKNYDECASECETDMKKKIKTYNVDNMEKLYDSNKDAYYRILTTYSDCETQCEKL